MCPHRSRMAGGLPNQVNGRLPWRQRQRGIADACGNGCRLPEHRPRAFRSSDLSERAGAGRSGRAAGLRFDLGGRAPLHRLHDVPRRAAVPVVLRRPHPARAAGLDGGGAAVARPDAGRRADLGARPPLGRALHPRHGPRRWAGSSSTASGVDQDDSRERFVESARCSCGARDAADANIDGKHYQAARTATSARAPFKSLQGRTYAAAVSPETSRDHGAARRRPADHPAEAVARGREGAHRYNTSTAR